MAPRSKLLGLAVIGMAGILGVGAALIWQHAAAPVELTIGTYLSPRRALPDFSLIDQRGAPFGPSNLRGHWSLLFFGYTNCPDFCPATLGTLAVLDKRLRASSAAVRPQVIFVSVDAKRDTPQQLAKYVPYFDPDFIGVTAADQATIEAVARKFGAGVTLEPPSDGSYTVYHSGAIFVVDPNGMMAAILTGPFTVKDLEADLRRIVAARA